MNNYIEVCKDEADKAKQGIRKVVAQLAAQHRPNFKGLERILPNKGSKRDGPGEASPGHIYNWSGTNDQWICKTGAPNPVKSEEMREQGVHKEQCSYQEST